MDGKNILKQMEILLFNSALGILLRHTVEDYEKSFKREELHSLLKIPTSLDCGNYLSISLPNEICVNQLLENFCI